ncbi:tudor domain-containing protein 3 isoform X2 [Eurosta solidaginis]|uniref:tudor domain-containing protein 3 isoform X2 n=1 Tax=Eurosta solidaginis TaxID=178769 RepID=UPI00353070B4
MELSKKLLEQGWFITEEGLKKAVATASCTRVSEVNDTRKVIATMLDMDFREIAGGALPTKKDDTIGGRIVLQLQKTRNISAPKANEDSKVAPRFLQLELSDGQTTIQALELEHIPALSMDLPPGTKIYFRAEQLQLIQGFLILRSSELHVLGGRVEQMVEKWELARTMQKYARSGRRMSGATGPPPWIQFGKKLETSITNDRNFKSLQAGASDGKESKENEEFNAMRSGAIAEASKTGGKKVFGGGGQQMLDHNVKKILEKGFSEEDAKQALRSTNNNLERALYNLKRRGEMKRVEDLGGNAKSSQIGIFTSAKTNRGAPIREIGSGKRGGSAAKEEVIVAKPAGNVSLFDFLTDKLPVDALLDTTTTSATIPTQTTATSNNSSNTNKSKKFEKNKKESFKGPSSDSTNISSAMEYGSHATRFRFENNMSSSFAANRSSGPINVRQRSERGGITSRGGRNNNEGGRSTTHFNPFKDNANENINSAIRSSVGQSINNNQNQGRNSRISYERGKVSNPTIGDTVENKTNDQTSKRINERTQQPKNIEGDERAGTQNEPRNRFTNKRDGNSRRQNNKDGNKNISAMKNTSKQNSNDNNGNIMNKLIDATSKIKLSDKRRSGNEEARSQIQNSQNNIAGQLPNQIANSAQFRKGYKYDTSLGAPNSTLIGQHQEKKPVSPRTNNQGLQPNLQMSTDDYVTPVSAHLQQAPSQISGYAAPTSNYLMPDLTTAPRIAPIPSHFGMVQGDGWNWKVGDLCFAKYWDDGRYYEAEVTAVSETTCVVFYLGYGNHEEVLKADCLPITDGNHYPINNYNATMSFPQPQLGKSNSIAPTHPIQKIQAGNYHRGGGGSQRFRERQMYVPPHKREN